MAQLWSDIKITTCEGRPCWANGRRAIFHRWTDSARPVKQTVTNEDGVEHFQKYSVHGLVEYEDGTMEREWPNVIQFADSAQYFQQFNWDAMEYHRDARAAAADILVPAEQIPDETDPAKLQAAGVAILKDMDQHQANIEVYQYCENCAHENPLLWADHCAGNDYNCPNCQAPGCICKDCNVGDKWEPKGGTA